MLYAQGWGVIGDMHIYMCGVGVGEEDVDVDVLMWIHVDVCVRRKGRLGDWLGSGSGFQCREDRCSNARSLPDDELADDGRIPCWNSAQYSHSVYVFTLL